MAIRPQGFDEPKAREVIVYLASRLREPTFHSIAKALYCADKQHLQAYGRFICGDHYIAMRYGPVPSRIYDMLKAPLGLEGSEAAAFVRDAFSVDCFHVEALRRPDRDLLSKSEVECLERGVVEVNDLDFRARTEITHDAAWHAADENGVMLLEDIAKTLPNSEELLEYLNS